MFDREAVEAFLIKVPDLRKSTPALLPVRRSGGFLKLLFTFTK